MIGLPTGPPDATWPMVVCRECKHITIDSANCEKCGKPGIPCGQVHGFGPKFKEEKTE